jgi:predicted RecB family endonuclease
MSDKNLDTNNRWRNKIVAFRMSPEEAELLDDYVSISGLTKQDYLISRVLQTDVVIQGNPRVYKALRNKLDDIHTELVRIENCSNVDDEFLSVLRLVATVLGGMRGDDNV